MIQQFISKLSSGEKKFFYITVSIVLVALFDRLFFGPALNKIDTAKDAIKYQEKGIRSDLKILLYKDRIIKENEMFGKYFTDEISDDDVLNAEFLSVIEKLATQAKVNLVKSSPSQTKKEERFVKYYADLDCSGELEDMVTFMHLINSNEELLKIVKFKIIPKRGQDNNINVSMSVVKMIIGQRNQDILNTSDEVATVTKVAE